MLVTGFDIIFFWVARMMMMGLKFMGDVPFRDVYITGLIRDEHGDKMSKSKGNVIDPLDIVDGIELDALVAKRTSGMMQPQLAAAIEKSTRKQYPGRHCRRTAPMRCASRSPRSPRRAATSASTSRASRGYRNFCNKLWNAARFVVMSVGDAATHRMRDRSELLRGRSLDPLALRTDVDDCRAALSRDYRFDFAATALYEFTWYEFCDWYLELTKPVLQSESASAAAKRGARQTLLRFWKRCSARCIR